VVIEPGAVLLTAAGETMQLEAKVYDAAGKPVQASVTWRSSDAGTVSVSSGGLATAMAGLGSAQITAVAQGVESEPALALVARPATGVVLIPDSLIVTDPVAVDPDAEYGPGWRYRIRVTGDAPEGGQLVIGTGGRSLAGRVVGATSQGAETELTVELVALNQLFADLQIDETIPLVEMETGTGGSSWRAPEPGWGPAGFEAADTEFKLGRFECTASGEVPKLDLPNPKLDIDPDLSLALGYANGLKKYAVVGKITADFGYKPVFKATFEGKVGCEAELLTATVPLGGFLALFVGIQVPLGVGFELDGKLEIAEVGFDVSAHAEATAELGLLCPAAGGSCSVLTSFDIPQPDFGFEFIAPDPTEQFKVELGAKGYLFAKPAVGSKFSRKAQFEFLAATAGLKQSIDLATATRQVKETDYASGFKLERQIDVGPGKDLASAIEKLGKWLGVDLDMDDLALVDIDKTLAESPKGTFTITPATVEPGNDEALGDMATFTIDLDPVTYLGIQSVEKVEIFWKKDDGNDDFTLEPGRPGCTDISGSSGQTKFECATDLLEAHAGEQTFYAFVHAKLFGVPLPIPLEVALDANAKVYVGEAECPVPPDWAVAEIVDSTIIEDGPGIREYTKSVGYDHVSVNIRVVSEGLGWVAVSPDIYITDYIKLIPLEGWPADERGVIIRVRNTGRYEMQTAECSVNSGNADIDLNLPFGGIFHTHRYCDAGTGTEEIDEVKGFGFSPESDWQLVYGAVKGNVRVSREGEVEASAELTTQVLGVEDYAGNEVAVKICSASGTDYQALAGTP
jgi:hypothetical protein